MNEPKGSLLPANSSPLEKALDLGFGQLLDRVTPPFPALMNPLQTPAEFLPYLAADRGVSEWDAAASESEKRLTVALSWQIQRQAGTPKALSYAVESLGFTPNISAWYQQRPTGLPYTFDVQAIIGRSWSSGDHNRLIRRINAAKSERDLATITIVHETSQGLRVAAAADPGLSIGDEGQPGALPEVKLHGVLACSSVAHTPLSDGELQLCGVLPELGLAARLNSAGVARHYTINDYDLRAQP
ncbi:phage tail protein I [Pseudomonas sp. SDT2931_S440]|jgi:phage tail P2-like protein|uniref:phage tail protein I n=1 Tax=unclassified Pseudomonas TaxID=196821 RepID=UPI0015A00704|nr:MULTISPECIES: phage tail protein I [unclassified Pseudomonas]MBT1268219.1 phage tail protein I [Pseudomonas sp. VS38]NWB12421.1 phage tail protein I [Pseudomonas sp. D5002]NWB74254.1 phage tail protein I [Pseudomonas sp. G5001]NWD01892.1 phage tail protein I [Pseudomonas sp. P7779]